MTLKTRRYIFFGLFFLFIAFGTGIILYSQGWRLIREGIDLMVEDFSSHVRDCESHGIRSLLFNKPWNQDQKDTGLIKRIHSWREVLREIDELRE